MFFVHASAVAPEQWIDTRRPTRLVSTLRIPPGAVHDSTALAGGRLLKRGMSPSPQVPGGITTLGEATGPARRTRDILRAGVG